MRSNQSDETILNVFNHLKQSHRESPILNIKYRKKALQKLKEAMLSCTEDIQKALDADLQKPEAETLLSEIYPIRKEIDFAIKHLNYWAELKTVPTPLSLFGTKGAYISQPKGLVLIIAPWNFPLNLCLGPAVSALAAGNHIIIKPSEYSIHTNNVLRQIISLAGLSEHIQIIEGDSKVSSALTEMPFDHIFFTGSEKIGKLVMQAAAKNLVPVTLELGGKNPVIVEPDANLRDACKSIVWSKFFNCGQVCISPDFVLVHKSVFDQFKELVVSEIKSQGSLQESGKIITTQHTARLAQLIQNALDLGAIPLMPISLSIDDRKISPVVMEHITADMALMKEEIFGPILPLIAYETQSEALHHIHKVGSPLAAYIFSRKKSSMNFYASQIKSGAIGINETYIQFVYPGLPFGGQQSSGIGKSHGEFGFHEFSVKRSIVEQSFTKNAVKLVHPPYTSLRNRIAKLVTRWL